jgi:hypothetical protein
LHTFCACTSPIDPPNTVKSCEATKTFLPSIVPYPVIAPSTGGPALLHPEVVRTVDGERIRLHEGTDVHQDVESFPRGQLPLVVLPLGSVAPSGLARGPASLVELVDPILDRPVGWGSCLLGLRHGPESSDAPASRPSPASRRVSSPPTNAPSGWSRSRSNDPRAPRWTATSSAACRCRTARANRCRVLIEAEISPLR